MSSFEKINYSLRPAKQIERKLIIETLQKISKAGFFVCDYTYLGFGSIFYSDFLLFHKYLLIDKMICVKSAPCPKRMNFNKPFDFIDLYMCPVSEIIPILNRETKYLVWLDYDYSVDVDVFFDIRSLIHILAPGSIFLITVAADVNKLINHHISPSEAKLLNEVEKKKIIVNVVNELLINYYGKEITSSDLTSNKLPAVISKSLCNFIDSSFTIREGIEFHQLFNFRYNDGTQMITIGGIVDTKDSLKRKDISDIVNLISNPDKYEPIQIIVPPLTFREKIWLEKNMQILDKHIKTNSELPPEMEFEIEKEPIEYFLKFYRQYPSYYEALY